MRFIYFSSNCWCNVISVAMFRLTDVMRYRMQTEVATVSLVAEMILRAACEQALQ